jgi:hypothetical protein
MCFIATEDTEHTDRVFTEDTEHADRVFHKDLSQQTCNP